ncbi:hypothetical protein ACVBEJ_14360 [Porticoccus sp. GXU_MW_L64]
MNTDMVFHIHSEPHSAVLKTGPEVYLISVIEQQEQLKQVAIAQALNHYQASLWRSSEALTYLATWGLATPEVIEQYQLGYSDRSFGLELPLDETEEGAAMRDALRQAGFFLPSGHELLRGALVVPNVDENGTVTGGYGVRLDKRLGPGVSREISWSMNAPGLCNRVAMVSTSHVVLCASPLEAITLREQGIDNVIATQGASGFSVEDLEALEASAVTRVYLAFPNTPLMERTAQLIAQAVTAVGIECWRIYLPKGQGIRQWRLTTDNHRQAFDRLLLQARPYHLASPVTKEVGYVH